MKPATKIVLALLRLNPDGLTSLECLAQGGGFRLGARIWELRTAGYQIDDDWQTTPNGARIKRYKITEQLALGLTDNPARRARRISA